MISKKVTSKIHWKFVLILIFTIIPSLFILITILKRQIENPQNQMEFGVWIFLGLLTSFGILFIIRSIYFI